MQLEKSLHTVASNLYNLFAHPSKTRLNDQTKDAVENIPERVMWWWPHDTKYGYKH